MPQLDLYKLLLATLRTLRGQGSSTTEQFEQFVLFRQKCHELDILHDRKQWKIAVHALLDDLLRNIEHSAPDAANAGIVRRRLYENENLSEIAAVYENNIHQVNRMQRYGIEAMAELFQVWEEDARRDVRTQQIALLANSTYDELFGVDNIVTRIVDQLVDDDDSWIVVVSGIGGIGKSAVADAAVREIISRFVFDHLAWIKIDQSAYMVNFATPKMALEQVMSMLASVLPNVNVTDLEAKRNLAIITELRSKPYLIAIDNIEHWSQFDHIVAHLGKMINPSKFLLTTRATSTTPGGFKNHSLDELSSEDSLLLMRHTAKQAGLDELQQAPDEMLLPVYELAGGNPLALKLSVSLGGALSLDGLIQELAQRHTKQVGYDVYRHIYQVVWENISPVARELLRCMTLPGDNGATREHLQSISELKNHQFVPAVSELSKHSLLLVRGSVMHERRYSIHRLTHTFVNEINGFDDPDNPAAAADDQT